MTDAYSETRFTGLYRYEVELDFEGDAELAYETAQSAEGAKKQAVANADGWPVAKHAARVRPAMEGEDA